MDKEQLQAGMADINQMATELVVACNDEPKLAAAIIYAAANLQASAAASDPDNPARSLKNALAFYQGNCRAAFQRFVRKSQTASKASGHFDS